MLRTSLAGIALIAAAPVAANPSYGGGKGSDVTTPIMDTREDILAAAGDAEGVAARATTIIELDSADRALFTLPPAGPLPSVPITGPAGPISAPSVLAGSDEAFQLAYLLPAGLLLPLLFGAGGNGGSNGEPLIPNSPVFTPSPPGVPSTPSPPGVPSGPVGGPPPTEVPVIPEPATWLMLLLGFGAMGLAVRRSRAKAAAAASEGGRQALLAPSPIIR